MNEIPLNRSTVMEQWLKPTATNRLADLISAVKDVCLRYRTRNHDVDQEIKALDDTLAKLPIEHVLIPRSTVEAVARGSQIGSVLTAFL